jgi:uncharacterized secreted protein with C-terminal beta-propeller domain
MTRTNYIWIVGIIALLAIAACTPATPPGPPDDGTTDTTGGTHGGTLSGGTNLTEEIPAEATPATQEFKEFKSIDEVEAFLAKQGQAGQTGSYGGSSLMVKKVMMTDSMAEGVAAPQAAGGRSATDYSQTNVQVADVDEGDYVKNDGRYIYMIQKDHLLIVDAYAAENAKIVSDTKIKGVETVKDDYASSVQPKQLFIDGDRLALFVEGNEQTYTFNTYDIQPQQSYRPITFIYIYDVSDRKNPDLMKTIRITGGYYQSRMIDGMMYIVTQEGVYYGGIPEPMVKMGGDIIRPHIYYFDNPEQNYQFNTLASVDITTGEYVDSMTLMMGYSNTLMVSTDNVYIAYQKQQFWCWWGCRGYGNVDNRKRFTEVVAPRLKGQLKEDIHAVLDQELPEQDEWRKISDVLSTFFEDAKDDASLQAEYKDMLTDMTDALEEYDTKKAFEDSKTIIQKIGINEGKFDYVGKGEVYGRLLNQFSLDEFDGNLRVATTVDLWVKKRITHNNVYVLDKKMDRIGELTGIAPDETIYSTRFMGDRLYMVTFKRIDPFFVIDLSDPKSPEVLGKLKIPGYSDYLHPYDATHIIGVGKDTESNDWGGTSTAGVKLAMFDVSDVEHPKLIDSVEIGVAGSDSPVLHDHKAFLFSKEKNLLVLPVTEVTERQKKSEWQYSNSVWNGAYVYKVTSSGFTEIGKVRHSSQTSDYVSWWNQATVQRSLYMDDNLYTISTKFIKINDLANDLDELNSITLPYETDITYPWWID